MKNTLLIFTMLLCIPSAVQSQSRNLVETNAEAEKIDSLMQASYKNGSFNGTILVSLGGKPIYKNAFGYEDKDANRKLDKTSVFYLASVSKQFTAMAIMILKEQKKLSYDDTLSKYFPEFPEYANTVTIRHLLTHTSGVADYFRLNMYKKGLTNADVIEKLAKRKKLDFMPGKKFLVIVMVVTYSYHVLSKAFQVCLFINL